MTGNKYINILLKVLIIAFIAYIFTSIAMVKMKIAGLLSIAMFLFAVMFYFFDKIDEKKFFLAFFFIYPLLPGLWGVNLPMGLPVLRAHRLLTLLLIIYLIRNRLFIKYYLNFIETRIFNLPLFFIIMSMFISSILSDAKGASIFYCISFIVEFLILSVVVYNGFKTREDIEMLITALCYAAFILCFIGIYEGIFEYNFYTIFGTYMDESTLEAVMRDSSIRVKGPFGHPISFGTYFALILPLVLYKYYEHIAKFIIAFVALGTTILMTQSRGAQIGAFIVISIYFIFVERKKIILMLIASIPFVIIFYEKILVYIRELNPLTATDAVLISSTTERQRQIDFYIEIVKQRPLFGFGLQPAPELLRDYHDGRTGGYANTIDNLYLGYAYQFGLIGLFCWIFLMIEVIRKPIMLYGREIFKDKLIIHLLSGFIIFNIINYIVFLWQFHFVFWIYLGVITRLIVLKINETQELPVPSPSKE